MTMLRFNYQREKLAETEGVVLNVGANEDAGGLKEMDPARVYNTDIEETDSFLGRPNKFDYIFDCREPWPFEDNHAELVIFGDILEHLTEEEQEKALREAHRVAEKVCITVPCDDRFLTEGVQEKESGYRSHCTVVTEELLKGVLDKTDWEIKEWQTVNYVFVPEGFFVLAERKNSKESE